MNAPADQRRAPGATWRVARLQLILEPTELAVHWGILALSLGFMIALMASLDDAQRAKVTTGGLSWLYVIVFIRFIVVMTQWFPFAVSLNVTRSRFFAATSLVAAGKAVAYGTALVALLALERATGGWGVSLRFFGLPFLETDGPASQLLAYAAPLVALSYLGTAIGVVFQRWGQAGVVAAATLCLAVIGAVTVVVTWRRWWSAVGDWLVAQTPLTLLGGWMLAVTAALAVLTYALLRRAVP